MTDNFALCFYLLRYAESLENYSLRILLKNRKKSDSWEAKYETIKSDSGLLHSTVKKKNPQYSSFYQIQNDPFYPYYINTLFK